MIITFWDHTTGCWASGDSVFDGKTLPSNEDDSRFWVQKEALLGRGKFELGEWLSTKDMRTARNVLPCDNAAWRRSKKTTKRKSRMRVP